jgi:segregation and condensation protein B
MNDNDFEQTGAASEADAAPDETQTSEPQVEAQDAASAGAQPAADDSAPHADDAAQAGAESEPDGEWQESAVRPSGELKAILEALIFASPDPLTPKAIYKLLDNEPKEDILTALAELKQDYERPGGLQLVEVAGGYQIVTRPDLHEWVRRLFHERSTQKLSVAALETLAVIAYRQPITALEIGEVRGVNTSGVLNTLLERHLIKIVGRKQIVGRPFMYATTKDFLIRFGLNDLSDLPKIEDMAAALGLDQPLLIEQSPSEELLPLEEPEADAPVDDGGDEPPGEPTGSVH